LWTPCGKPASRQCTAQVDDEVGLRGWRLDPAHRGRGLATEAATAASDDAFTRLGLPELISVIHPSNARSQRVAAKLGMTPARQIDNPVLGLKVDVWHLPSPR
jgi:RimJ/RimL family protein N-acetyltransferase